MSCPENQTMIDSVCYPNTCVIGNTICSGNGTCGGFSKNKCICTGNHKGFYCQCPPGSIQIAQDSLECAQNFCQSPKGQCFGRSECELRIVNGANEFTCKDCGKFTGNDPRQGCSGCLTGFSYVEPLSERICVHENCISERAECAFNGTCTAQGKCVCEGDFDPATKCAQCKSGSELKAGKCVENLCLSGETICSNRGTCDEASSECRCESNYSGSKCELCAAGLENIGVNECVSPDCVNDGVVCSANGKCGGVISYKCVCENGTSGKFCQCPKGKVQVNARTLECAVDLCVSPRGNCFRRGNCIHRGDELVCRNCGIYSFNDPRQGCYGCLVGSSYFGPVDNRDCRPDKCIIDGTICNYLGSCLRTGVCECFNKTLDPETACTRCISGYTLMKEKCVHENCIHNGTECDNKGTCKDNVCVCETYLLNDKLKCSECVQETALIAEICTICKPGFEFVYGECTNIVCSEGQVYNMTILGCEDIQQNKDSFFNGLIAGIVILLLVIIIIIGGTVYYFTKKRNQISSANSIIIPKKDSGIQEMKTTRHSGLVTENEQYAK
ncbi:Tenascin-like protein [Spironucleus salmonicida]|uniref:Cysteine-rich membrane protein 2 n=1 Tax=Spironucleus salmonicida TaxID=348837 RepID=V6M1L2_9EUKA|nr:Tenascin-like protein [Spironucleus salmonicida]|eukprot:EST47084.1 Cysteine-rich membrane protein 2 [Spironucleus salmonicida]